MKETNFDFATDLIMRRRSIYPSSFKDELVDDEMVLQLLNNANQAPSHRHTEPWRFHVISAEAKDRFAVFMQDCYKQMFTGDSFNIMKLNKISKKIAKSSHIIMISMMRDKNDSVPEWEELAATACAVQNLYLSVTAAELGGYWSTPDYFINEAKAFFEMEEGERCLGLFYLGVPMDELPPRMEKKPIEDKTRWYRD
jgi:nitroreductase